MNHFFLIILVSFFTLSCHGQYEKEFLRGEDLESKEFQELKLAYHKYLNYGKKNYALTAIEKYRDNKNLKDTLLRYSFVRDSLLSVLKSKSTSFYAKFPSKSLDLKPDEMKAWLDN